MFPFFRSRVTYANVVVTFALVFAMGGGAYAAGRFVITSTKQISPKVLKQLKGSAGAKGAVGLTGPAGAAGPQGPAGGNGKDGTNGANGQNGTDGVSVSSKSLLPSESVCNKMGGSEFTSAEGKKTTACNGQTGFTENLPSGKTEMGTWDLMVPPVNPTLGVPLSRSAISFVIPLESAPAQHFLMAGEPSTTECPGTATEPQAEAGQLCIYATAELDAPKLTLSSYRYGAIISGGLGSEAGEPGGVVYGSWAVTAAE